MLGQIQSKMQTSALLAGFTSTVFGVMLTQSDYWTLWLGAATAVGPAGVAGDGPTGTLSPTSDLPARTGGGTTARESAGWISKAVTGHPSCARRLGARWDCSPSAGVA